jgi:hypothetical protein
MNVLDYVLIVLVAGVPYAWVLARVAGHGFFQAKRHYQMSLMRELDHKQQQES